MTTPRPVLAAALAALAACATPRTAAPPAPPGAEGVAQPAAPAPEPKIALALGGGAARGFAHVGVIRVLEQERIPIDLVVGTSVGSLIGAIYAGDRDSFELEWTAFQLERDDLFDFGIMNALMGMGYAKGEKLEAFVRSKVKQESIEQLPVPYAAVATDLNWGTRVVLDRGPIARAVRASSAIPGVFEPVVHQGKMLVDGGLVDNVPIDVARAKGADLVIAVDISENVGNTSIKNVLDVMLQATNILWSEGTARARRDADVLVSPAVGDIGTLDFSQKKRAMQAGMDAARKAVPQIRAAIEAWKARHAVAGQGRG
ncbi:MAG TPA: patatin-like phospholipase family protein [Anaeromyxobacteraceae bacterium]|nr:patatin-like phospholipase family protein [Anaeromyxobacteraceae bacterium]